MTYEIRERALDFAIKATPFEAGTVAIIDAARSFAEFLRGAEAAPLAGGGKPFVPPMLDPIAEAIAEADHNEALAREVFGEDPAPEEYQIGYGHTGYADDPESLTSAIKAIADEPPEARDASSDPEPQDEPVLVLETVTGDPEPAQARRPFFNWRGGAT